MKIKVAATSLESAGIRSSPSAATVARTAIVIVLLAVDMFAVKLAAAQQVAFKAGRVPRIYNALITSDQRLLPSQADPIVAPVFRPFPFFYNGWPEVYAAEALPPVTSQLVQKSAGEVTAAASAVVPEVSAATSEAVGSARARDDGAGSEPASVAVVKNNKPVDTSVPDVPPPPLPVSRAGAAAGKKKKPEEFPPPPVSFAI